MIWAASYLGIPFLERGVSRRGCDCWGLLCLIFTEQRGIALPDYAEVPAGANRAKIDAILAASIDSSAWQPVAPGAERAFDVVLMRGIIRHEGAAHSRPIHVGCVIAPGRLIHIEQESGVMIADYRRHPVTSKRVEGFFRYAREMAA